jgi:hypothetical protein
MRAKSRSPQTFEEIKIIKGAVMKNLYLDLSFVRPKKTDLPFSPFAHIELKSHSEESNGQILIGEKCVTFEELDRHICWLEKELEAVRKKAKMKFSKGE